MLGHKKAETSTRDAWVKIFKPEPRARLRLFCFAYAGGSAQNFYSWPRELPATIELCAVQLPGRGGRMGEPPFTSMPTLVEAMLPALLPYFNKPFAFFGHSMGAMISFELARQLRRETGREPLKLFVSGQRAPQLPRASAITYNLPEPEFLEELRRLNGTPREVLEHPELMSLLLSLLRADFELVQTYDYQPGAPLNCPISAFGGAQDVDIPRSELDAWREQTTAAFSLQMFPGDHFFLHSSQAMLLQRLSEHLQRIP